LRDRPTTAPPAMGRFLGARFNELSHQLRW
jgi:hypothetical protein